MKTIRIVKITKDFGQTKTYFPMNLITKIARHKDGLFIYSLTNSPWIYFSEIPYIKVIDATPQEQFLFYLNYEKPFVLEEKL